MNDRRVVVTGLGLVTPLGHCVDTSLAAIARWCLWYPQVSTIDASLHKIHFVAISLTSKSVILPMPAKQNASTVSLNLRCALVAPLVRDSGLDFEQEDRTKCGVILGSGMADSPK